MIFKNKKAYVVTNETRNKTNTKGLELLNGDFIFSVEFKFNPPKKTTQNEFCILGRAGYGMGFFCQLPNQVKWAWWEENNGEITYNDIFADIDCTKKTTLLVTKCDNKFFLQVNDEPYDSKEIKGTLYNYSQKNICVGSDNPYSEVEEYCHWFNGEIYDVKIYHGKYQYDENMFLWYDFKKSTNFKVFDKSGNGNHGEIFETIDYKEKKNIEFNKVARPAKIV